MTFDDLIRKFLEAFPSAEIDDYRPVCHELFEEGMTGITIWLKNGDMVVYYPAQSKSERKIEVTTGMDMERKFEPAPDFSDKAYEEAENAEWGTMEERGYIYDESSKKWVKKEEI